MAEPHNRIALVTSAGSGKASAMRLVEDGWRLVFTGRRLQTLREAIDTAADPFGDIAQRAPAFPADVTRLEAARPAARANWARWPRR
jgi:NADP-dependent 3-hydroxy acid dehydrogenase YdfG